MSTEELIRAHAYFAFPFSQKNAAWVDGVSNQHTDSNAGTF